MPEPVMGLGPDGLRRCGLPTPDEERGDESLLLDRCCCCCCGGGEVSVGQEAMGIKRIVDEREDLRWRERQKETGINESNVHCSRIHTKHHCIAALASNVPSSTD